MWNEGNDAGFMNDSIVNEPSRLTNTVVSASGDNSSKTTMPVSLSQISKLTRPDEGLIIHGSKAANITVVAKIVEVLESSAHKLQYLIDDLTNGGPMEVQFIRSDAGLPSNDPGLAMFDDNGMSSNPEDSPIERQLKVDDYVRMYGLVKFANDKPTIMAYKIIPVLDPNEITMHILEVIRESMYALKSKSGDFNNRAGPSNLIKGSNSNIIGQDKDLEVNGLAKLPTIQRHIYNVVKKHSEQHGSNNGISTDNIVAQLRHMQPSDVIKAIQDLSSEGQIWNGGDEDTWCLS